MNAELLICVKCEKHIGTAEDEGGCCDTMCCKILCMGCSDE